MFGKAVNKAIILHMKRQTLISCVRAFCFGLGASILALCSAPSTPAQDNELFPVPDTYKVEGVPPIKKSDVESLFYDPSAIKSNLIWDADLQNRRLLVTDEHNTVYLLDSPMRTPVQLIAKIVPNRVKMRPDGSGFAYTSDHEHEDNYQLYYYNFKDQTSKKLSVLTGKDESVESFAWTARADSTVYSKVDYDTKTSKVCRNDLSTETCFPLNLKGIWNVVDADSNHILIRYAKGSSSHFLYVYDIFRQKLIPIDERGDTEESFLFGNRVFWISAGGNELCQSTKCILFSDLTKVKTKRLDLPENLADFDDARFSPTGKALLVQESKNGVDNLRVFRLHKNKITKEVPSFISGSFVIWNTRWLSENEIVYTLENTGKPASIQSFDILHNTKTDWTKDRLPPQLEGKIKPPDTIVWKSFDGREIPGFVVRPAVIRGKSPVLIFVHGGPQIVDKPVFSSQDVRFVSSLGLTIIHTNIRGSTGFGKEFMDADDQEKRGDAVKDIQALIDWVEKQPDLDSGRVYLRGQSYGGFVVLSAALQEPARIKGVIAEYPLISIRDFLSQSWIDEFARNEYGDPRNENLMKKLDQLSPLNNTEKWNRIPLFLTRGKLDARSPEQDVIGLKTQLQDKGSDVWFIYSTGDGHGFGSKYVTAAMFKFLKTQINKE